MKLLSKYKYVFIIIFLYHFTNVTAADEVIIESDEKAKEIFMGSKWKCRDAINYATDKPFTYIEFDSANKRKVTAKVWKNQCPQDFAKLSGKISKNSVKYKVISFPKGCWKSIKGSLDFYSNDKKTLNAEGFYNGKFITKWEGNYQTFETIDGRLVCEKE